VAAPAGSRPELTVRTTGRASGGLAAAASTTRSSGAGVARARALLDAARSPGGASRALSHALEVAPIAVAAALWILSMLAVDPREIGDIGLIGALPAGTFAAFALACVGFAIAISRPRLSTPLILLHVVALVVMLYGATSVIDKEPAFNVVWRHAGVVDHIATTGDVDATIDAYFNWPGFFLWAAAVSHAAGLDSTLDWSGWAPVVFELSYLPALVVIARAFTQDQRLAWGGVWIFYLTNWVGQDYFSPQAISYLVYLAVIAVALTCFARRGRLLPERWRDRRDRLLVKARVRAPGLLLDPEPPAVHPLQRSALLLVTVVLVGAVVAAHQLTPWMIFGSLVALVLFRRSSATGLPGIVFLLLLAWLSYMAAAYLGGHLKPMLGQALDLNESVSANIGSRIAGSEGHLLVVKLRLLMTAIVWALAVAGAVRGLRRGRSRASFAYLALAPAAFVILQPYGGEMLLRVYLFSLPFTACFAAQALAPSGHAWTSWRAGLRVALVGMVAIGGFLYTRYGNESATLFTSQEVRSIERLYDLAPQKSLLVAASPNLPWKQRHYADYRYRLLSSRFDPGPGFRPAVLAAEVAAYMDRERHRGKAYLVLTRSQRNYDELLGAQPWGSATELQRAVTVSPRFRPVIVNADAAIFELRGGEVGAR